MNKIIISACALSLLAMTSCKGNANESANETAADDSTSTEVASTENVDGQSAVSKYYSPDTQLNDLFGEVAKCVTRKGNCDAKGNTNEDTYWSTEVKVFDRDGFIDAKSEELNWRLNEPIIERNDKEQISVVKWFVSDYNSYVSEEYKYNKDGMLASCQSNGIESADVIKYEYEGTTLVKSISEGAGEGSVFRNTVTYTILDTDKNGNWTRRLQKGTYEDGPDDGSGTYGNAMTEYSIEERTITYYK